MKRIFLILAVFGASLGNAAPLATGPEQRAAAHFETLRQQRPAEMQPFLREMPKGADLHNHLSGAVYAESFIQWAASTGLCVSQSDFTLKAPPCDPAAGTVLVSNALTDEVLYGHLIDSWSMRNWEKSGQTGHDHFFDTFGKFGRASSGQTGAMLAEVVVPEKSNFNSPAPALPPAVL